MSAVGPTEDTRPLTDQEYRQVQRLLSDPFSFPLAFKAWLTSFVETSDLRLPAASVHNLPDAVTIASDAIPKQTFDAKGDLLVGTADDHYDRLPIGANDQALIADNSTTRGMRWATALAPPLDDVLAVGADAGGTPILNSPIALNAKTASYVLVLTDAGKLVTMTVATPNTLTIPTNASVAFPLGTQVQILQLGAGTTTVVAAGGVTLNSRGAHVALNGQNAWASLVKIATNTWQLFGDLV